MIDNNRFLQFKLGQENYAVELLLVREVLTPTQLTPVPGSPSYVSGLMNLRGDVISVIDLRKKLGIPVEKNNKDAAIIIFSSNDSLFGALVSSVDKVLNIEKSKIKPLPDGDTSSHLTGIIQTEAGLCLIIEPSAIFTPSTTALKAA